MEQVKTHETLASRIQSIPIGEATTQEVELELIRRRQFGTFDGERVVDCLLRNRELWRAVMMDRLGLSHPGCLPTLGLMKLRDLPADEWNVDTLFVLTRCREDAERLAELLRHRCPGGFFDIRSNPTEVRRALPEANPGETILSIWWE